MDDLELIAGTRSGDRTAARRLYDRHAPRVYRLIFRLVGEEELVIKPLDSQLIASELASGASILGDGTVVLMLNLAAVVEHYSRCPVPPLPVIPPPGAASEANNGLPGGAQ